MKKKVIKICAVLMALFGFIVLASSVYPIILYEWESGRKYADILSPIADEDKKDSALEARDFTKLSNWFDESSPSVESGFAHPRVSYYTLVIPKLGITGATVKIGGDDLSKSLVQWEGTAIPGKLGNAVVFGHSVLPQYFNPNNYLSIFSTLPKLDKQDLIYVNYDGITYKYSVEKMFEVKPTAIDILEQNKSNSFLTLVTCVPPGDPRKPLRLIVRARLVPLTANADTGN